MDAALISVGLFLTWGFIGFGPLSALIGDRRLISRALLAPSMGLALVTVPAFLLNRIGYPVEVFALTQVLILCSVSIVASLMTYRHFPSSFRNDDIRTCGWLLLLLFGAFTLVDWPALHFGTNWLGYANDDMANYALSATRLKSAGYFGPPLVKAVLDGSDMSQLYWNLTLDSRYGGDLVLAVIASVLQVNVASIFMPTMIALHVTLIAAAAGLAVTEQPRRSIAFAAVIAGAINPLIAFSTFSELLAQVGGIGLASGLMAVLVDLWQVNARRMAGRAVVGALFLYGLFIWYYELLVLVLPAIALYAALHRSEVLSAWKRLLVTCVLVFSCIALLSGSYLQAFVRAIGYQFEKGTTAYPTDVVVFPYFLVKEGLSSFWGLSPIIGQDLVARWKLVLSLFLFCFAAIALINSVRQGKLSACIVTVLSAAALMLLWRQADFGTFKAVLFLQPFLSVFIAATLPFTMLPTALNGLLHFSDWPKAFRMRTIPALSAIAFVLIIIPVVAIVAVYQLRTFNVYGKIADDQFGSPYFNQLPGGSRLGLLSHLDQLPRPKSGGHYVLDTDNSVLTKLLALYTIGIPTRFLSYYPFKTSDFLTTFEMNFPERASETRGGRPIDIPFQWTSGENDILRLQTDSRAEPKSGDILVAAAADNSVLNRLHLSYPNRSPVIALPLEKVSNHLSFLPTLEKARHYFDYDFPPEKFGEYRSNIAFWPNEPDYFYKGRTLVGTGRYVLLRVINPERPRIMLEITASLNSDGENRLPPIKLFNQASNSIGSVGRGSARLFSQSIKPFYLDSAMVIGIDMGNEPARFADTRGGFTSDTRRLTSFIRDISLISDEDYRVMKRPSKLENFPDDLANKNLEYSGIYEDGWMAESATLLLAAPTHPADFSVVGMMPWNPATSGVSQFIVRVDGVEKARQPLTQGEFSINIQLEPSEKPILVELQADGALPLSAGDRRPASVRLVKIGW